MTEDQKPSHDLALQVVVAVAAGAAGLRGPELGAVAASLIASGLATWPEILVECGFRRRLDSGV